MTKIRIAIYSRKSKFSETGDSIQNQIELCKEYAEVHFSIGSIDIYEDEGFSGGNTDRPQFKRLIQDAKKKRFDTLICYRLDRVSRSIKDFSNLIEMLKKLNITFVSLKEQFDTSSPMGRAMMYITSVFAQLERETIAERIRDNMLQLAKTGRWLGGRTPTGFRSKGEDYYDINNVKRKAYKLIPVTEELKLVEILYAKFLELNSLTQLESFCIESDITSRYDKTLNASSIKVILSNPVYAIADELLYEYFVSVGSDVANRKEDFDGKHGILAYNKNNEKVGERQRKDESEWIIAIGKHKGIIQSSTWVQVQMILKKNSVKAPRRGTSKISLLTPMLACGNCGSRFKLNYKYKDGVIKHHYYKCAMKERSRGSKCQIENINGQRAEKAVIDAIKGLSIDTKEAIIGIEAEMALLRKSIKNQNTEKAKLIQKLKEYEKLVCNLTMQLAMNKDSTASKYIVQQIEELDIKISETKNMLNNVNNKNEQSLQKQAEISYYNDLLKDFAINADKLRFEEKKTYLKSLIHTVVWDGQNLHVTLKHSTKINLTI